jgi:hypothetical protein
MVTNLLVSKYQRYYEYSGNIHLQRCIDAEKQIIGSINNAKSKTLIHPYAGYGMFTPYFSNLFNQVISIENNQDMLIELRTRSERFKNACVVEGNIKSIKALYSNIKMDNAVLVLNQNIMGNIEKPYEQLKHLKNALRHVPTEVILTLYRNDSMRTWGLKLYSDLRPITGELDFDRTDYHKGLFVFETGQKVKWWRDYEIKDLINSLNGRTVEVEVTKNFLIYFVSL